MADPKPPYVTPDDIRLFLVDKIPADNFLLDDIEFTPEEIASAMQLAIDKANSLPPLIWNYHVENFPFRYQLVIGTASMLLRMKAFNYARNKLDFQTAEGTAVQDKNKAQDYIELSKMLMEEFVSDITRIKRVKNLEDCWLTVGSGYMFLRNS